MDDRRLIHLPCCWEHIHMVNPRTLPSSFSKSSHSSRNQTQASIGACVSRKGKRPLARFHLLKQCGSPTIRRIHQPAQGNGRRWTLLHSRRPPITSNLPHIFVRVSDDLRGLRWGGEGSYVFLFVKEGGRRELRERRMPCEATCVDV